MTSLGAQLGALRTQLDLAERKATAATARADAWKRVHELHLAVYVTAAEGTDDDLDEAIAAMHAATDIAEALEQ